MSLRDDCDDKKSKVLKIDISLYYIIIVAFIDLNAESIHEKLCQFKQKVNEWLKKSVLLL